jgi:hypothetical protein
VRVVPGHGRVNMAGNFPDDALGDASLKHLGNGLVP